MIYVFQVQISYCAHFLGMVLYSDYIFIVFHVTFHLIFYYVLYNLKLNLWLLRKLDHQFYSVWKSEFHSPYFKNNWIICVYIFFNYSFISLIRTVLSYTNRLNANLCITKYSQIALCVWNSRETFIKFVKKTKIKNIKVKKTAFSRIRTKVSTQAHSSWTSRQ
jgi:hypothetical protein